MAKSAAKKTTKAKPTRAPARKAVAAKPPAKKPAAKPTPPRKEASSKPMRNPNGKNGAAKPVPMTFAITPPKPVKNLAGLKSKELEIFRDLLLAKRRELLGDVHSMEEEALRSASDSNLSNLPIHMADMGTDNYEQEFTLGLVEKDRQLLREINVALIKIRDGTYGMCEGTNKPITKARLEAKPWARYSIEHTRKLESGLLRG